MTPSFVKIALEKIYSDKPIRKAVVAAIKSSVPSVNLITENGNYVSLTPKAALHISKHLEESAYLAEPKLIKLYKNKGIHRGINPN